MMPQCLQTVPPGLPLFHGLYTTPLTCDCIDLGRPRQPLQKIDGFQHTHPRGRLRFHPLPGNRSESGRPAPGDVLKRGAGL